MAKTKKHRKESSDSDESAASTSSSSSSESTSAESSSSSDDESKKKRKLKKMKNIKSKRRRKRSPSTSSSSSSSESQDESSTSSSSEDNQPEKEKAKISKDKKDSNSYKRTHSDEKRPEQRPARMDSEDPRREASNSHNRSKWDSPSNEGGEEYRRDRQRNYYDRNYYGNNGKNTEDRRNRRYEDFRNERYSNWRNENRDRPDRRRNRENDYGNRGRNQKNFRFRDNNYNDRRDYNRENRGWRDDDRQNRRSRSPRRPRNFPRRRSDGDQKSYDWGKREENDGSDKPTGDKEKPNFGLSGKLTEDTNKVNGIVIKYAEPLESRKPKRRWRLYPFKGEKALPTLYIHRQSCYLIGRDRKICDLPVDHPSCSKQHAAFQYRLVPFEREDGTMGKRVRPYIIDLESANGTFINNKKIDSKKYIELLEKDVIKFGFSSREYVLLHENSKEDQLDDDITEEVQVKEEPAD